MWEDIVILCFVFNQGMHYFMRWPWSCPNLLKWIILSKTIRKVPPLLIYISVMPFLWQVRKPTGRFCALSVALCTPKNFLQGLWTDDSCPFKGGTKNQEKLWCRTYKEMDNETLKYRWMGDDYSTLLLKLLPAHVTLRSSHLIHTFLLLPEFLFQYVTHMIQLFLISIREEILKWPQN